jgi:hypothetical protein
MQLSSAEAFSHNKKHVVNQRRVWSDANGFLLKTQCMDKHNSGARIFYLLEILISHRKCSEITQEDEI